MNDEQRTHILQQLADAIRQRHMAAPARLTLDVIAPVAFLASQVALFAQPLTPRGRWHEYVLALEEEQSWNLLRQLLDRP